MDFMMLRRIAWRVMMPSQLSTMFGERAPAAAWSATSMLQRPGVGTVASVGGQVAHGRVLPVLGAVCCDAADHSGEEEDDSGAGPVGVHLHGMEHRNREQDERFTADVVSRTLAGPREAVRRRRPLRERSSHHTGGIRIGPTILYLVEPGSWAGMPGVGR